MVSKITGLFASCKFNGRRIEQAYPNPFDKFLKPDSTKKIESDAAIYNLNMIPSTHQKCYNLGCVCQESKFTCATKLIHDKTAETVKNGCRVVITLFEECDKVFFKLFPLAGGECFIYVSHWSVSYHLVRMYGGNSLVVLQNSAFFSGKHKAKFLMFCSIFVYAKISPMAFFTTTEDSNKFDDFTKMLGVLPSNVYNVSQIRFRGLLECKCDDSISWSEDRLRNKRENLELYLQDEQIKRDERTKVMNQQRDCMNITPIKGEEAYDDMICEQIGELKDEMNGDPTPDQLKRLDELERNLRESLKIQEAQQMKPVTTAYMGRGGTRQATRLQPTQRPNTQEAPSIVDKKKCVLM